jgi:hypothetical protein
MVSLEVFFIATFDNAAYLLQPDHLVSISLSTSRLVQPPRDDYPDSALDVLVLQKSKEHGSEGFSLNNTRIYGLDYSLRSD